MTGYQVCPELMLSRQSAWFLPRPWLVECIFPSRLHRLAYLLRGMAIDGLSSFLFSAGGRTNNEWWWVSFLGLWIYALLFVLLPRIRDAGMSRWWLVFSMIPGPDLVTGILLLFRAPAWLSASAVQGLPASSPRPNS